VVIGFSPRKAIDQMPQLTGRRQERQPPGMVGIVALIGYRSRNRIPHERRPAHDLLILTKFVADLVAGASD
jgi:hypothetical protein